MQLTSRMYCVSQVLKKKVMKTLEPVRDSVFIFKSTINMDAFLFCFSHPPFFSPFNNLMDFLSSSAFHSHLILIIFLSHPPPSSPPTLQSPHLPLVLASSSAAAATSASSSSLAQGSYSASSVCAESLGKERA